MHLPGYMFFHLLVGHGENSNPHKITPLHAACPILQADHLYSCTPVPTLDPRCECEQNPQLDSECNHSNQWIIMIIILLMISNNVETSVKSKSR